MTKTFQIVSVAVLAVGGAILWTNYDDWFVRPKIIESKRGFASARMKDPLSAQFRNEKLTEQQWLCGEMNVKNGLGAYTGFKRFISGRPDAVWIDGIGYAGTEKAALESSRDLTEQLAVEIEILKERNRAITNGMNLPRLTPNQVAEKANSQLFEDRWQRSCS